MMNTTEAEVSKLMEHVKMLGNRDHRWIAVVGHHTTDKEATELQKVYYRRDCKEFLMVNTDLEVLFPALTLTGNISNEAVHHIYETFLKDEEYTDISEVYKENATSNRYFGTKATDELDRKAGSIINLETKEAFDRLMDGLAESGYFWSLSIKANEAENIWDKFKENTVIFMNNYNKKLMHFSDETAKKYNFDLDTFEKINVDKV